jgi:hypothetical protein
MDRAVCPPIQGSSQNMVDVPTLMETTTDAWNKALEASPT